MYITESLRRVSTHPLGAYQRCEKVESQPRLALPTPYIPYIAYKHMTVTDLQVTMNLLAHAAPRSFLRATPMLPLRPWWC